MWRCVRVLQLWGIAAAIASVGIADAAAQDAAVLLPADGTDAPRSDRFLFFSGVEFWRASTAAYGGLHWSSGGLNNDGAIARLVLSRSLERYDNTSTAIIRAAGLAGARFKQGEFELKLMLGPQLERLDPTSPAAHPRGTRLGLQGVAESWWEPTPALMLASSWSASTLGSFYGGRLAAGARLSDLAWIGPELAAYRDEFSTQTRVGLHVTALRWQDLEWSAAAGYLRDSFHRSGAYGRIGVLLRR